MPADWSQEKGMGVVHRNYNLKTTPARGYSRIGARTKDDAIVSPFDATPHPEETTQQQ